MKLKVLCGLILCHMSILCSDRIPTNQELFAGKNILITGGTGYLGRTIAEAILPYQPALIKIMSRDEVKVFNSQQHFRNTPTVECILGDVRDYASLAKHTENIDLVFHAAALKRIDMIEYNIEESIRTNIIGSFNVFNACVANGVKKVIFISTDKACFPINTYGACKFISEKIFTNYNRKSIDTNFIVVRFGNILESTGSVIPVFANKIKRGENLTLTDERMTRFIITKNEAVDFMFDALRYGVGGEIFVKILPSFSIVDLIQVLREKYNVQSSIDVIGIRPGEKIHEILINKEELRRTYTFNDMSIITPSLHEWLENLTEAKRVPLYITQGKLIRSSELSYSSKNAVLSYEDLKALLYKLNV